ncbi:hypothetical protein BDF20DRAFT_876728 [Mycotypha africana]|uniref:uncharacterized protein n=1 Tax=Mycotypha africana TaxID=64632 RepID=UPI0023000F78|nr:uncharacterized protein BDF20DRAFT_876728 [Mycotypha africana]KAI8975060.1 hypothetical protein BDF20DRAFT_876728 [Mycotypha africana]
MTIVTFSNTTLRLHKSVHASTATTTASPSASTRTRSHASSTASSPICHARGKNYCLVHRRYFETSWCPDCSRVS